MSVAGVREAVTRAHHEEWARVVASLARRFGDPGIAEEAAAEAFAAAAGRWPADGVPPSPGAWLTTTASRKAIDRIRRENKRDDKQKEAQLWYDDDPREPPRAGESNLPLGELDPEVLERLAAEMIRRRPNRGAHFYGRRGQKQYGLDILEREAADANSVYQVRRYEVLTADDITSAVTEYADPQPPKAGGEKPARRFAVHMYVLFTSAEFETETGEAQ